jgi:hypothetical protein
MLQTLQSNVVQGTWRPFSNSNTIGLAGYLLKIVNPASANPSIAGKAAVDLIGATSDVATDILVDDGANPVATTNQAQQVTALPLSAVDQFRVPVVSTGSVGDILVLAGSGSYGKLQQFSSSPAGTYLALGFALENYIPGQFVLVRKHMFSVSH